MKNNKKNIYCVLLYFLVALVCSVFLEVFAFNFHAIAGKKYVDKKLELIATENIEKKGNTYVTMSDQSKIILKGDHTYIEKIKFEYETEHDFSWDMIALDEYKNEKIRTNKNASILDKAVRRVGNNAETIELIFHNKDVKIKNITVSNEMFLNIYRIITMTITLFLLLILYRYRKYFFYNLHKTFLLLSLTIGLLLIFVTPVSMHTSWDDQVHFSRSYTLLDGKKSDWSFAGRYFNHLIIDAEDRFKSYEEIKDYKNFLNKKNTTESTIRVQNDDHSIDYNELAYIPFAIGLKLGRVLHFRFTTTIYFAKILNLLFYITLFYFALKILPYGKRIMFVISLLPTALYLATQFSYDSTVTAGIMLGISSFLKLRELDKINYKYLLLFIFSVLWATFPKAVYAPLLLLILLIPKEKFATKESERFIKIGTILLFLVMMSSFVVPVLLGQMSAGDSRVEGTSVSGQLICILKNPFSYIKLLGISSVKEAHEMFFGYDALSRMGYLTTKYMWCFNLSNFVTLFLLLYTVFTSRIDKKGMDNLFKMVLLFLLIIIWCLVWTSLYLSWNPVGSTVITGVQGRYFIPLLFPLLLVFIPIGSPPKRKDKLLMNEILLLVIPMFILVYNIFFVIFKFYR